LKFWAIDYMADVWLNDQYLGRHENGETPFDFDVTDVIKPGGVNRLAGAAQK
jgi:beta-galactosidase/beta-glucuronidase